MEPSAAWETSTSSSPTVTAESTGQGAADHALTGSAIGRECPGDELSIQRGDLRFLSKIDAEQFGGPTLVTATEQAESTQSLRETGDSASVLQLVE